MPLDGDSLKVARGRLTQVFQFLQEFNQLRNPVKRLISEQPWVLWFRDLPDHASISRGVISEVPVGEVGAADTTDTGRPSTADDFILKVSRPALTRAPGPAAEIAERLLPGWDNIDGAVRVHPSRNEPDETGQSIIVQFEDDPRRPRLLSRWQEQRNEWVRNERPARDALKIFERLYELRGLIERESERVELALGDGILNWRLPEGGMHHPVLLQRLQLEFDPSIPQFTISETDQPVELYSALFRSSDLDGRVIGRCLEELQRGPYHPLGDDATSGFLRSLVVQLSAHGQFVGQGQPQGNTDYPRIGRAPVLFLRTRTLGFATAIEEVLKDLQRGQVPPQSLTRLVGIEPPPSDTQPGNLANPPFLGNEDDHILLSKPANLEQLQIADRLERYGSVLVQGPPGTGKTHTIANLIGHLLAQGKSILVTSHTTKALRMVREQVIEELRPLCVSVLERDASGRDQLKDSINSIVAKSSNDANQLDHEANDLDSRRWDILAKLRQAREKLLQARNDEYESIVVAGENHDPSEAARRTASTKAQDSWIPGPVTPGALLPLPQRELIDLYRTNEEVTPEDERELAAALPRPEELLAPVDFERVVEDLYRLSSENLTLREDLWGDPREADDPEVLEALLQQLVRAVELLEESTSWKLAAINAGRVGSIEREPWGNLISLITRVAEESAQAQEIIVRYAPFVDDESLEDQARILDQIITHLVDGGRLGWWTLLTHATWKRLLTKVRVAEVPPQRVEHFHALKTLVSLKLSRRELLERWERQVVPLGAPGVAELGDRPELRLAQFCQPISDALDWYAKVWIPLEKEVEQHGFQWQVFLREMPPNLSENGELLRLRDAVLGDLPSIFAARANGSRQNSLVKRLWELTVHLDLQVGGEGSAQVVRRLREAVTGRAPVAYYKGFERLVELNSRRTALNLRQTLLLRLEVSASVWADAIRVRRPPHDGWNMPGDPAAAWLWRQLHDELERRGSISLEALQKEIEELSGPKGQLQQTTAKLIDRRAWAAQIRRTSLSQRQDLTGWLQMTNNKIRGGTSRHTPRRQAEAQRLLSQCQTAVPVWIMPLSRVVENFNPAQSRFDVVIVDEASQLDVMGLLALYMGKQVIVVGDDEQVSPAAVGLNLDQVNQLQDQFLRGIPNPLLYDGQTSVYDFAYTCFGGVIRLAEHFRCVPDIIQFSNDLSYNGEIEPLRDGSSVQLKPHTIAYRVEGASSKDRLNEAEALTLASLLIAATEQLEYQQNEKGEPVSFGVISLVGEEHAYLIDSLLHHHLSPVEYERRRIVCGNAAHFQGDERDVMFLSVVDAPRETKLDLLEAGPTGRFRKGLSIVDSSQEDRLGLRQAGMFKKRFNVAASRARDQMWIIHSLDPQIHLQVNDLRRRLIEHAQNPKALMQLLERGERRTESVFERQVLRHLVSAGYRVTPQWKVGYKRIDLVVEGGGKRLAVECDGDRSHPLDKLREDMIREADLRRLGWTFERIRGSRLFRDPDGAMRPVFTHLETLGVTKESLSPTTEVDSSADSELRDRIVRRADELRREWQNETVKRSDPTYQRQTTPNQQASRTHGPQSDSPAGENRGPDGPRQPLLIDLSNADTLGGTKFDLIPYLSERSIETIDNRPSGGSLWVIGGRDELSSLMKELGGRGIKFTFSPNGGRATGRRPSWFTKWSDSPGGWR